MCVCYSVLVPTVSLWRDNDDLISKYDLKVLSLLHILEKRKKNSDFLSTANYGGRQLHQCNEDYFRFLFCLTLWF